jgi:hypothetical protein
MMVSMLEAFAESTTPQAIVFGHAYESSDLLSVTIDFGQLQARTCPGVLARGGLRLRRVAAAPTGSPADFEPWRASDSHGNYCLLGHNLTFLRRKADSACKVGNDFKNLDYSETICNCTAADFEWSARRRPALAP